MGLCGPCVGIPRISRTYSQRMTTARTHFEDPSPLMFELQIPFIRLGCNYHAPLDRDYRGHVTYSLTPSIPLNKPYSSPLYNRLYKPL